MPFNRSDYPNNWYEISAAIRRRAQDRCEFCGVSNRAVGYRDLKGEFHEMTLDEAEASHEDGIHVIQIVLTVAHLDHNPANCDPSNLRALCQRCHNRYDRPMRDVHASHTRAVKRAGATLPLTL